MRTDLDHLERKAHDPGCALGLDEQLRRRLLGEPEHARVVGEVGIAQLGKAQRPGDVAWNTANSRNRRMFNDPAGLAAARNLRSYLVQSYARDMGNGNTVMMREIDVPIRVQGRHWGGFRTAYKL